MTEPTSTPVNTPVASPTPQTSQTPPPVPAASPAPVPTPAPAPVTPTPTPVGPRPTPTPVVGKKPVSKISLKGFMIGCGVLLVLVVGGLTAIFYNLIKNPNQLNSLGLGADTTKTLLQTFAAVFFGLLVFLGIALLVVNLYRIITVKNQSKVKYTFGTIGGLFIFIVAIAL